MKGFRYERDPDAPGCIMKRIEYEMSLAEEEAYKAYPPDWETEYDEWSGVKLIEYDKNVKARLCFQKGFERAQELKYEIK